MPGHIGRTHLAEASVHEHWTIATPRCDTSNGASFFLSEPAADKNPTQSQARGPRDCSREAEGMLGCRDNPLTHPTPESLCARAGDVSDVFEQDYLYLSCSFSTDCKVLGHNVTNVTPRVSRATKMRLATPLKTTEAPTPLSTFVRGVFDERRRSGPVERGTNGSILAFTRRVYSLSRAMACLPSAFQQFALRRNR
jgi:hypothetical protein